MEQLKPQQESLLQQNIKLVATIKLNKAEIVRLQKAFNQEVSKSRKLQEEITADINSLEDLIKKLSKAELAIVNYQSDIAKYKNQLQKIKTIIES